MPLAFDQGTLLNTLKARLLALEWETDEKIFGLNSVFVGVYPAYTTNAYRRLPVAVVVNGSERADPSEPGLRDVTIQIALYHNDYRDDVGQTAIRGDDNSDGVAPQNRRLDAVTRRVELSIQDLARNVVPIRNIQSASSQVDLDNNVVLYRRTLTFTATVAVQTE